MLLSGASSGDGHLQGPGRWREAVLLWWGWRAGTGAGLGRGEQDNLTPEPHCSPGGTQDLCHLAGGLPEKPSLQAAAVLDWFRSRDVQTVPAGSVSPILHPGLQLPCLRSALALGSDVILGMTAVRTAQLWEKDVWRRLDPGLRSLLPVFTGI